MHTYHAYAALSAKAPTEPFTFDFGPLGPEGYVAPQSRRFRDAPSTTSPTRTALPAAHFGMQLVTGRYQTWP